MDRGKSKTEKCVTCKKRRCCCQSCSRCNDCGHHTSCSNKAWGNPPQMRVYYVLISYDNGTERMQVSATDTVNCFAATARIVGLKQQNLGVHQAVRSITIEHE